MLIKNLPFDSGNRALTPGQVTTMPYAMGQLSLCATNREPVCTNEDPAQTRKKRKKKPAIQVDRLKDPEDKEMMAKKIVINGLEDQEQ